MDELYKNLVKLKPKDNVPFKCIGCGECCKHVKEQVPVEPWMHFVLHVIDGTG